MNASFEPFAEPYQANLNALRAFQPDVARRVEAASVPASIRDAVGRDGTRTFLLRDHTGRDVWFGQSSMPGISAEAIFTGLQRDGGSVWLPGILTGVEPLVVAERLPAHCAVFVLEPDPLLIKLALRLHDYTPLIASGRIVFILAAELEQSLQRFFERYPGYEAPRRLLTVPQVKAAEVSRLQRRIEEAMEPAGAAQTAALKSVIDSVHETQPREMPSAPRVAVLSVDPSPLVTEQAARVARAMNQLGWTHRVCVPDAPGKCHVVARIRTVQQCDADVVLVLGDGARWLRPLLPEARPVLTWNVPGCPTPPAPQQRAAYDLHFATSRSVADEWRAAGIDPNHMALAEPAADTEAVRTDATAGAPDAARPFHVAIFMDLPDARAEAAGISLQSHRMLWEALHAVAADAVETGADDFERWLGEAEKRTGITLRDPEVRRMFVAMIRTRLAPAALGQAMRRAATDIADRVSLWGTNWSRPEEAQIKAAGPIPLGHRLFPALRQAEWIVLPDVTDRSVQLALDALAVGTGVICRGDPNDLTERHPRMASLARALSFFQRPRQLRNHLHNHRPSTRSPTPSHEDDIAAMVCREHSTAVRLTAMLQCLREKQRATTPPAASLVGAATSHA